MFAGEMKFGFYFGIGSSDAGSLVWILGCEGSR